MDRGTAYPHPDRLMVFAQEVFESIPRIDQKRWAEVYLTGLLSLEGKKSLRRIAETVAGQPVHQSLQQFLNQSPWDWAPVRHALARHAVQRVSPEAWVLDQVVIPKRGKHSVGVDRQYIPRQNKAVNCQIGLGLFLGAESHTLPLTWRLLLGQRWTQDTALRESVYLPDTVTSRPGWHEAVSMVKELMEWKVPAAPVVVDLSHAPDAGAHLEGFARTGAEFVAEVDTGIAVLSHTSPAGSAVTLRADDLLIVSGVRSTLLSAGAAPTADPKTLITLNGVQIAQPAKPVHRRGLPLRLLGIWSAAERRVTRLWATNLSDPRPDRSLRLARFTTRVRSSTAELTGRYGLQDFEGRSFQGWHHHATMVSAAAVFQNLHTDRQTWESAGTMPTPMP